FLRN
uniref:Antho-RNamide n=1 Tax=Anthopleura elegantissima TaxID=6110 RepID=FLRN_ANTEL